MNCLLYIILLFVNKTAILKFFEEEALEIRSRIDINNINNMNIYSYLATQEVAMKDTDLKLLDASKSGDFELIQVNMKVKIVSILF